MIRNVSALKLIITKLHACMSHGVYLPALCLLFAASICMLQMNSEITYH